MRRECEKDWEEDMEGQTVEESWKNLKGTLDSMIEEYVPLKVRRINNQPKWMSREIRGMVEKKEKSMEEMERVRKRK